MNPRDREAFAKLMVGVAELYGKPISPELISIYWDGLSEHELDEVRLALNLHMRNPDTGQFMPKPADVIRFLTGNTLTQAMRAWQKVDQAVRHVGGYQTVVFDDPIIHAVIVDMGGWMGFGQTPEDEWHFKARDFERRYQSYKLKPPADYPRKLIGIFEAENGPRGFVSDGPMLIGDAERARLVYEKGAEHARIGMQQLRMLAESIEHE